jgi:hypothetical protein
MVAKAAGDTAYRDADPRVSRRDNCRRRRVVGISACLNTCSQWQRGRQRLHIADSDSGGNAKWACAVACTIACCAHSNERV